MPERIVPESVGPGQALDLSKRKAAAFVEWRSGSGR